MPEHREHEPQLPREPRPCGRSRPALGRSCRRPPRASSTSAGASSPAVIRVVTNPGLTTSTRAPVPAEGIGEALGERIEPRLRRRRRSHCSPRGRSRGEAREHDERPAAALTQPAKRLEQQRPGADEVDLHHLERLIRVGVEPRLAAEHADREHHHVEPVRPARTRRAIACRWRVLIGGRVELLDRATLAARAPRAARARRRAWARSRPSRNGPDRALLGEPPDDREADLGRASDQEDALRSRGAHPDTRPVLSARSERHSRSGSTCSRTSRHSDKRGYIAASVSGRVRASFER